MEVRVDLDTSSAAVLYSDATQQVYVDELRESIRESIYRVFGQDVLPAVICPEKALLFKGTLAQGIRGLGFRMGVNLDLEVDLSIRNNSVEIRLLSYAVRLRDHWVTNPTFH
jgi:hypothetical protein